MLEGVAKALNGQNICAVKMATSEPVRHTRECRKKIDFCAPVYELQIAIFYQTILNFVSLKRRVVYSSTFCLSQQISASVDYSVSKASSGMDKAVPDFVGREGHDGYRPYKLYSLISFKCTNITIKIICLYLSMHRRVLKSCDCNNYCKIWTRV